MRDFHLPGRSAVFAENGMVATSHPLAAAAGVDMLKRGGNAADAALAAATLLGICEPQMTGLGGDLFALVGLPEGEVRALNASGRAPAGLDAGALRAAGPAIDPMSAAAVTLPGAVAGICALSDGQGRLDLAEVLEPAIRYAEAGVPVAERTAFDWAQAADRLQGAARAAYLLAGAVPRAGQVFRAPGQAEVLRRIAAGGAGAFYGGEVAEDMRAALAAAGGAHTAEDFAAVRADWTAPVSGRYGAAEIVEHPPNGQGPVALLLLNILAELDLAALDPFGAERAHLEAEAARLAYDARDRFLADPAAMDRADRLEDPALARRLAGLIDPGRAMPAPAPLTEAVHRETVLVTAVDRDRMAVSLIYSIFHAFGSGIASPRFGILFHSRGSGFTLAAGHPNEAGPGKRPMHTILPALLRRAGRVEMPFGVMGGHYQPSGHARLVTNMESFGMSPQEAIDGPRSFATEGALRLERGYRPEVADRLAALGHRVERPEAPIGGAQAVRIREDGVLEGASDPRKDGCALGY